MDSRIDVIIDIRGFNRFYTNMLGLLNANIGSSDYSLTETRIIYEISKTEKCSANQLSNILRIDTGYLSRILKKLEKEGVLERHSSEDDARINEISLTEKGIKAAKTIYDKHKIISEFLTHVLKVDSQTAEIDACKIEHILSTQTINNIENFLKSKNILIDWEDKSWKI